MPAPTRKFKMDDVAAIQNVIAGMHRVLRTPNNALEMVEQVETALKELKKDGNRWTRCKHYLTSASLDGYSLKKFEAQVAAMRALIEDFAGRKFEDEDKPESE